jgi:hypothetical protein
MRNERLIYANVVNFEHDIRRRQRHKERRAALAQVSTWFLVATAVVASIWWACEGVLVR